MSEKKPVTKPIIRWRDKEGKWHQKELPAQPIRELPPREKPKRRPA